MRAIGVIAVLTLLAFPGVAFGHGAGEHGVGAVRAAGFASSGACEGEAIAPDQVIAGSFSSEQQGSYVLLPFDVPADTTAVRVKYCYEDSDAPLASQADHTLDLGIYDALPAGRELWGETEFRGWGGSSHPDVTLSAEGFDGSPRPTSKGFLPGPVEPGRWAVELGVAAVVPREQGDSDGRVDWRVEIDLIDAPAFTDEPYEPAPYDDTPARSEPGWYAGDLHVHAEHSSLGDAPMRETFDYAFGPAGLDFITLSDYVTSSAWGEIGRYQQDYPGRLITRSAEVITYRGHINNHDSATYVDYRTGPIYERMADGTLQLRRGPEPASRVFEQIHAAGGWTQINHPTIFPSSVPLFAMLCRGCSWEYSGEETNYREVDAIEIATGPAGLKDPLKIGPNPFTVTALDFYERALSSHPRVRIAAVGSSDSHHAGRTPNPVTQAPIGQATTVVYAEELSNAAIQEGVESGHTYVKLYGNDGPDLRFEARRPDGRGKRAIMGDTLRADGPVNFTARVLGAAPLTGRDPKKPDPYELVVLRDGVPFLAVPVTDDVFEYRFTGLLPGRYRLQLQRSSTIEAVSSPIYFERP